MDAASYSIWLTKQIENAVDVALNEAKTEAARIFRTYVPNNRVLTRQALKIAVVKRSSGYQLRIRLHFSKQYRIANDTATLRIFLAAWRKAKPHIVAAFHDNLNHQLSRI